jgi:hypothetical protein
LPNLGSYRAPLGRLTSAIFLSAASLGWAALDFWSKRSLSAFVDQLVFAFAHRAAAALRAISLRRLLLSFLSARPPTSRLGGLQ